MVDLTDDELSMLQSCGFSEEDVDRVSRGVIEPEIVHSGEHDEIHNIPDGIDSYLESIPPVVRVFDGYGMLGNDGNHRINTCVFYHKKLPVSIIYIKE